MQSLLNKKIVLGVSGGIAAYKTPELARLLMQEGASVQVVMTGAAQQFVTPVTMQALTGNPVYVSQWDARIPNNMAHIDLSRSADAILIAPASADLMAKLSLGLADDLLSTLCLARDCPLLLAPAMNRQMWEHAATQRSAIRLQEDGVGLLGPASGFQACGETGMGRMLEPTEITDQLIAFFQKKLLAGKKVLITAGPTFEAIDPVRGITNHSSGKMGFAIARAAIGAGYTNVPFLQKTNLTNEDVTPIGPVTNGLNYRQNNAKFNYADQSVLDFAAATAFDAAYQDSANYNQYRIQSGSVAANKDYYAGLDAIEMTATTAPGAGAKLYARGMFASNDLGGATKVGAAFMSGDVDIVGGRFAPPTPAFGAQVGAVFQGSGVPSNTNGNNGDIYFRTDTPATANQRIYVKSAGAWIAIL